MWQVSMLDLWIITMCIEEQARTQDQETPGTAFIAQYDNKWNWANTSAAASSDPTNHSSD